MLTLAAGLLLVTPLGAQTRKPLIELTSLHAEGLGAEEARLIGNLIRSYLSDFGEVVGHFDVSLQQTPTGGRSPAADQGPAAAGPPRAGRASLAGGLSEAGGPEELPDYILSGRIRLDQGTFTFILEIDDTAAQETNVLSMESQSMGEMVLRARSLVETAFNVGIGLPPSQADSFRLDRDLAMGTWRGEQGLEMIRLYNSGRGIAVFSSGLRINLSWHIAGDILRVEQSSPNTARLYPLLSPEAAAAAAEKAEPLRWELRPQGNRNTLRGERIFTAAGAESPEQGAGRLLFGQREGVEWIRSIH
jgi:hypothetical protein